MLEFFANVQMSEIRLVRFIESQLHCGLTQRTFGADEMVWSRGMYALLDLDPKEVRSSLKLLQEMEHPDDRLPLSEFEANLKSATRVTRKFRIIRKDGTQRVLSQHAELLFDSSGKPDRSLSIYQDVSEAEAVREGAIANWRRIKAFANSSDFTLNLLRPDGFVTGILGDGQNQASELNRRYGFLWRDLIHPEDRAESITEFERAVREKVAVKREHRIKQPDGSYRWRRSMWVPILDGQNNLIEFGSVSQDIEAEKNIPTCAPRDGRITGAQIRAGRALARWSVQELSEATGISASTIRRLEEFDGVTAGSLDSLSAICEAMAKVGVEFIFPAWGKPGVRLA